MEGEEEREKDEKYEGKYKRNRWPIYEVYHPTQRSPRENRKNGREDIIKEIIEENFPDLKKYTNLQVKKVLEYR